MTDYFKIRKYLELHGWELLGFVIAEDCELAVFYDEDTYNVALVQRGWDEPDLCIDEVDRFIMAGRRAIFDSDHGSGPVKFSVIMMENDDENHVMFKHAWFEGRVR